MSLHPHKKSDADKKWRQSRDNRRTILEPPQRHLIVTEGTKTEPLYFEAMKNVIESEEGGLYRGSITIQGMGYSCLKLLQEVADDKEVCSSYAHIWLVYDKDDFSADDFDNTMHRCTSLSVKDGPQFHALWSNQCIELWFLLHYDYMHADICRAQYIENLSKNLENGGKGKYEKNRDDMFDILLPRLDTAMANAKKLRKLHKAKSPSKCSPGTAVYELFDMLKPYLQRT